MDETARAWVEIDLGRLRENVKTLRALLPPGCELMPVLKANAYGHGAALIGGALQTLGVRQFCVATVGEGAALRKAGITGEILVLGYTHPSAFDALSTYDLTQTALDYDYARILSAYGERRKGDTPFSNCCEFRLHREGAEPPQRGECPVYEQGDTAPRRKKTPYPPRGTELPLPCHHEGAAIHACGWTAPLGGTFANGAVRALYGGERAATVPSGGRWEAATFDFTAIPAPGSGTSPGSPVIPASDSTTIPARGLKVQVGVDTGMRRLGERSENLERILRIWALPGLNVTGVFSHLAAAEGTDEPSREKTARQLARFERVLHVLRARGISCKAHIQGSAGLLHYPALRFDYVRPGLALYGATEEAGLRPVLSLHARVAALRTLHAGETAGYDMAYTAAGERRLAAVTIGYADGLPRALGGRGELLLNGHRAPVVGRVCMDQLLLDVTGLPAAPGDEVVAIGSSGEETLSAAALAAAAGTIPNEILSGLSPRLGRVVRG